MTEVSEVIEDEKKEIRKSKVVLICAGLVVILAISSAWLYTRVNELQGDVEYWQFDADYWSYVADNLNDEVDSLTTENNQLQSEIDTLNSERDSYIVTHQYSNWEYELARFDFYYVLPVEQSFGTYALDDELDSGDWGDPYERGVFDCSEMSAYMEWELENLGWHTIIVAGDSPFGSGYHAWLLVECEEGKYMPVEATTLEVVWWDDPYFDNYWEYDHFLEDILDALDYSETEFDWWE